MKKIFILFILLLISGCTLANVKVEMLSERTALENQVLGSYNSLDSQMLLAASVRGGRHQRKYFTAAGAQPGIQGHHRCHADHRFP